jgi:putative phosphoribosyl transferase
MDNAMLFEDRAHAGRELADRLLQYKDRKPVVLALPRGGVPVGFEIAKALKAPLDIVLVRKIGAPWQPELAIGAVADGDHPKLVLNEDLIESIGLPPGYIEDEEKRQLAEIERRRSAYLAGRPRTSIAGMTAIVVDDGIATGATARVALQAVRQAKPERLVLAVPVAPVDTVERLRPLVDDLVCLSAPAEFGAISLFYLSFPQVSDEEVCDLLSRANAPDSVRRERAKSSKRAGAEGL